MKVNDSVAIISIKTFPIGLHVMDLYFLDKPRYFVKSLQGKQMKRKHCMVPEWHRPYEDNSYCAEANSKTPKPAQGAQQCLIHKFL